MGAHPIDALNSLQIKTVDEADGATRIDMQSSIKQAGFRTGAIHGSLFCRSKLSKNRTGLAPDHAVHVVGVA